MNLQPTADQFQIIDAVAAFMSERLPVSRYRSLAADAPSLTDDEWRQIIDLGWIGFSLEEEHGGLGSTLVEETLLFREVGRQAGPLELLGSVIGARVAALGGAEAARDRILAGEARVAIAVPAGAPVSAGPSLDGEVLLFAPRSADYAVLVDEHGAALFDLSELTLRNLPCLERPVSLASATLQAQPALAFVAAGVDPIAARLTLLASAMQVGGAEAARDMAVEYAKERKQFGQPIGSFQALKHICSDMAVRCEESCSQLFYASLSLLDGDPAGDVAAAAFLAARAAMENGAANIQVHGGMGMTAELDAHWYLKRAHVLDQIIGNSRRQLDLLVGGTAAKPGVAGEAKAAAGARIEELTGVA